MRCANTRARNVCGFCNSSRGTICCGVVWMDNIYTPVVASAATFSGTPSPWSSPRGQEQAAIRSAGQPIVKRPRAAAANWPRRGPPPGELRHRKDTARLQRRIARRFVLNSSLNPAPTAAAPLPNCRRSTATKERRQPRSCRRPRARVVFLSILGVYILRLPCILPVSFL